MVRTTTTKFGDIIAHVKLNGSLVNVHHGSSGYFVMTNERHERVPREPQWPKNNHPNRLWVDIENCDVPKDLDPEFLYERIVRGLAERNYMGTVTISAIFAKMTEHIPLDMVAKLVANKIRMVDLGLYNADAEALRDAADHAIIKEIEALDEQFPCNVMVLSGDYIFHRPLQTLKEQGYMRTLAAFRPDTVSNEYELNAQVWDSWVFRHLLDLPCEVGKKPNQKQSRKRSRGSGSGAVQHYSNVSTLQKLPALLSFLKQHPEQKMVIFFSTCRSVEYHAEMIRALDVSLVCSKIHGNMRLRDNLQTLSDFKTKVGGHVLLCSDALPLGHVLVDWIVRFDMPHNLGHYLFTHRREVSALLLLDGTQTLDDPAFEKYKVAVKEINFVKKELREVESQVKKKRKKNDKLEILAREADIV